MEASEQQRQYKNYLLNEKQQDDEIIQFEQKVSFIKLADQLIRILKQKPKIIQQKHRQNVKLFQNHQIYITFPSYSRTKRKTSKQTLIKQNQLSKIFTYFTFSQLKHLAIQNVNLNNCQFVSFMNLPALTNIDIIDSKIQTFKPFTKANLPSLKCIQSDIILSKQINIQRSNFSQLNMIIFVKSEKLAKMCINLSFLVKMQSAENVQKMLGVKRFWKTDVSVVWERKKYINKIMYFY